MAGRLFCVGLAAALGACAFHAEDVPGEGLDGAALGDARAIDAIVNPCPVGTAGLVACWEFEGDGVDGSGNGHDAVLENVGFSVGHRGTGALLTPSLDSRVFVAAGIGVAQAYTVEAWIMPLDVPTVVDTRRGVYDTNGQMSLFVYPVGFNAGGMVRCSAAGPGEMFAGTVTAGSPIHLACTYDSTTGEQAIYINGVRTARTLVPAPTLTPSGASTAIGSDAECLAAPCADELSGVIDSVRVWSVARTAQEICAEAGTGCN